MINRIITAVTAFLYYKEDNEMDVIYATLIIKGLRSYESVPDPIKPKVKEVLIGLDCSHLITEK